MNKECTISAEETDRYDVVVAGGGPAGIGAAIACASKGCKTLLIENSGCLGGTGIIGNLPYFLGAYTGSVPFYEMVEKKISYKDLPRPRKAVGGIFTEVMRRIAAEGGGVGPAVIGQTDQYPGLDRLGCHDEFVYDMEIAKRVLDEMVLESGTTIRYFTSILEVQRTGDRVDGLFLYHKEKIEYVAANYFIDATGDADIVDKAGFATYKGDRTTGLLTNSSLVMQIENVDPAPLERALNAGHDPWFRVECQRAIEENPDMDLTDNIIIFPMVQKGVFMINGGTTFSLIDATNPQDLTKLMILGRQRAKNMLEKTFRPHIPGFSNASIRSTASYPGIRESRRIIGETTLTEADLFAGTRFPDTIALAGRHFDLEKPVILPDGRVDSRQPFHDKKLSIRGGVTPVPYGILIPKGAENLLAAGRCVDADGQAMGPVRIMSTCFATGQAAGTATAICCKQQCMVSKIDRTALQNNLRQDGAEIDY